MKVEELMNVLDQHTTIRFYTRDGKVLHRRLTPEAAFKKCGNMKVVRVYTTGRYEMEVVVK